MVADNSKAPNSRWYSGSGMYREAQLYVGPKTCILPEGVKVSVLDQERIRVDVELTGPGAKESDDQLEVEILFEGRKIATAQGNHAEIVIPDVKLWDEEHPDLYQCRVTLKKEGAVADEAAVSFGMRIVRLERRRFLRQRKSGASAGSLYPSRQRCSRCLRFSGRGVEKSEDPEGSRI